MQQLFCRSKDALSYKAGSAGSGSSTGTPADVTNNASKKRTYNSTLVTDVNSSPGQESVKSSNTRRNTDMPPWSRNSGISRTGAIRRSPVDVDRKTFAYNFLGKTDHKCDGKEPVVALLQAEGDDCRRLQVHF